MQQRSTQYILNPWLIIAIAVIVSVISLARLGKELQVSEQIRLNQLGFYPAEEKQAGIACENIIGDFYIRDMKAREIVYTGEYVIEVPSVGKSDPFNIHQSLLRDASTAALKVFYCQRSAIPLEEQYVGLWNLWSNAYRLGCQTLIRQQ